MADVYEIIAETKKNPFSARPSVAKVFEAEIAQDMHEKLGLGGKIPQHHIKYGRTYSELQNAERNKEKLQAIVEHYGPLSTNDAAEHASWLTIHQVRYYLCDLRQAGRIAGNSRMRNHAITWEANQ